MEPHRPERELAGGDARRNTLLAAFACAALSFLFYGPTLTSYFVIDDGALVHLAHAMARQDPAVLLRPDIGIYWRPVGKLLFAADALTWGTRPFGYHLTNVLLHALCCVLVFRLGWRLYRSRGVAWAATLVFAVHPIHFAAVGWISARYDLLATVFVLAALLAGVRHVELRGRADLAWLACFELLALFSKELAFVLPALLLLVSLAVPIGGTRERLRRGVPAVALSIAVLCAVLAVRWATMGRIGGEADFFQRGPVEGAVNAVAVLLAYMYAPVPGTGPVYGVPGFVYVLAGLALLILSLAFWVRGRERLARAVPLGMAFVATLPFSPFLRASRELDNAYQFYLASAFFAVGLAGILFAGVRRWTKVAAAALIALVFVPLLVANNARFREAAGVARFVHDRIVESLGADPPLTIAYVEGVPRKVNGVYIHVGDLSGYFLDRFDRHRLRLVVLGDGPPSDARGAEEGRAVRHFRFDFADPAAPSFVDLSTELASARAVRFSRVGD